jgi:hypothetical protein
MQLDRVKEGRSFGRAHYGHIPVLDNLFLYLYCPVLVSVECATMLAVCCVGRVGDGSSCHRQLTSNSWQNCHLQALCTTIQGQCSQ